MLRGIHRATLIGSAIAALTASFSGLAQSPSDKADDSDAIKEIVVTATRRAERLQDVPISVAAFSSERMDSLGLHNMDDLSRLTSGMTFQRNGMGSSANYNDEASDINIRGIDSQAGSPTVGVYVDDTPIQSRHVGFGSVNAFPQLFDLDRVEVLKGPQGTLFGAGAEGGAVRFLTPEPGLVERSGYLRSELAYTDGGDESYEVGAAAGGPLIDNVLGYRVSASFRRDGGWVDRVSYTRPDPANPLSLPVTAATNQANANWQRTISLRGALKWVVSDKVTIEPSLYYQQLHINDTAAYWIALSDPTHGIYNNGNALTNPSTDPFYIASVKVTGDLGFAQLTSNTAYYSRDQHSTSDYTQYLRATWYLYSSQFGIGTLPNGYPQPGDRGTTPFGDRQNNLFQEFRLTSSNPAARVLWNAGAFLAHTDENVRSQIFDPTLEAESGGGVCAAVGVACPGGLLLDAPQTRVMEKQIALFGDITLKITDAWKATAGIRVAKVDVTGTSQQGGAFVGTPLSPLRASSEQSSEKPVTPKFVLSYEPTRDNLYYASVAKGYRTGGVNAPVALSCGSNLAALGIPADANGQRQVPLQYSPDSLWSYEIGAKNSLLDRRLQVNASLFLVDWKNIIQNVYLPTCGEQYAANLGQVRSRGGDIEVTFRPIRELALGFTAAYTDAKFTRASCAGALQFDGTLCSGPTGSSAPVVSEGDRLVGAPWTIQASSEYSAAGKWLGGRTGYVRVDYQVTTAQTARLSGQDYRNALFDDTIPGLPRTRNLQLRTGLRVDGLDLSLFANNLLNDHPLMFASRDIAYDCVSGAPCGHTAGFPVTDNLYFGRGVRPRTVGMTATYRY